MLLTIEGQEINIDQLKKGEYNRLTLSDDAKYLVDFILSWLAGKEDYFFETSGSSGKPKKIRLTKEVLYYSASQTLSYLKLDKSTTKNMLLCISPRFIGGIMLVVRALISKSHLIVVPASSRPNSPDHFFLTSMVPLQIMEIIQNQPDFFNQFEHILIGGAALTPETENSLIRFSANFYHTYGMTETASHIAIRRIGEEYFQTVGDIELQMESSLELKGTVTGEQWLKTNDQVKLINNKAFKWLGRADFVINSGGYKVHPEKVEAHLSDQIKGRFIISFEEDVKLGQKVILIAEAEETALDLTAIGTYERPRSLLFDRKIFLTKSGKIDRNKTRTVNLNL